MSDRHLWTLPLICVAVAVAIYLTFTLTRGSADQAEWLGIWAMYLAIFLVFAAGALVAYRMLRRSRADAAMDEARSKSGGRQSIG